jgi:hypothetical protein
MNAKSQLEQKRSSPRERYVREVLRLYTNTPTVLGKVRRADRILASQLFNRHVPLYAVQHAFVLASARRIRNNAFSTPLPPIRSLHYFSAVIQEILERPPGYREIDELRRFLDDHSRR